MTRRLIVLGLLMTGLLLLCLGQVLGYLVPTSAYWGESQAREFAAAQVELHAQSHHHEDGGRPKARLEAARVRFEKINQEFEAAENRRARMGTLFTGAGVFLLITGIGAHLVTRQAE